MSTLAPIATKLPLFAIFIHVAEGPFANGNTKEFHTWKEAHVFLALVNAKAPLEKSYHKTDVRVQWTDGNERPEYQLRYDAAHNDSPLYEGMLADRIRKALEYTAGLKARVDQTDEQYQESLARMERAIPGRREKAMNLLKSVSFVDAPSPTDNAIEAARKAQAAAVLAAKGKQPAPVVTTVAAAAKLVAQTAPARPAVVGTGVALPKPKATGSPTKYTKVRKISAEKPTDIRRRLEATANGLREVAKSLPEGDADRIEMEALAEKLFARLFRG